MTNKFLALSNLGKNGAARWLGGTLLILFLWFVVGSIFTLPFLFLSGANLLSGKLEGGDPFWIYLAVSASFPFIWLGVWLAVRFLHQRAFRTIITPAPKISWTRLAQGFGVWFGLIALVQIAEFVMYPARAQYTFNLEKWIFFLPFVLILTPIQTSAEELLFRGYWLQGVGRLTQNVIILCVVNGMLFALPHMLNPEVTGNPNDAALLFLNYFATGAALAFFTLHDNRLELALGAHAANNLFAGLVVNYQDSSLTTPAFFTNPVLDATFGLIALVVISIAFYFIVFRVLDRRTDVSA